MQRRGFSDTSRIYRRRPIANGIGRGRHRYPIWAFPYTNNGTAVYGSTSAIPCHASSSRLCTWLSSRQARLLIDGMPEVLSEQGIITSVSSSIQYGSYQHFDIQARILLFAAQYNKCVLHTRTLLGLQRSPQYAAGSGFELFFL